MKRLVLLAALLPLPAAAMDFGDYTVMLQTDAGRASIRAYLDGFGAGIGNYEVHQALEGRGRRFCPPNGTPLSAELLAGLVDRTIKQQPALAQKDMPVASIVWVGLERQFPCPKGKTG